MTKIGTWVNPLRGVSGQVPQRAPPGVRPVSMEGNFLFTAQITARFAADVAKAARLHVVYRQARPLPGRLDTSVLQQWAAWL